MADVCSIITMLAMINLLCIALTLIMTEWLAIDVLDVIIRADEEIFAALLIVFAIIGMFLIFFGKVDMKRDTNKKDIHHHVLLTGLLIFGVPAMLFYMFDFSRAVYCTRAVRTEYYRETKKHNPLEMELYKEVMYAIMCILQIISISFQLIILRLYRGGSATSACSKLCILVILTANSTIYINTFVRETQEKLDYEPYVTKELLKYLESHVSNNSAVFKCVASTTGLDRDLNSLTPYVYPFDLEFYLVAAGILLSMLIPGNDEHNGEEDPPIDGHNNEADSVSQPSSQGEGFIASSSPTPSDNLSSAVDPQTPNNLKTPSNPTTPDNTQTPGSTQTGMVLPLTVDIQAEIHPPPSHHSDHRSQDSAAHTEITNADNMQHECPEIPQHPGGGLHCTAISTASTESAEISAASSEGNAHEHLNRSSRNDTASSNHNWSVQVELGRHIEERQDLNHQLQTPDNPQTPDNSQTPDSPQTHTGPYIDGTEGRSAQGSQNEYSTHRLRCLDWLFRSCKAKESSDRGRLIEERLDPNHQPETPNNPQTPNNLKTPSNPTTPDNTQTPGSSQTHTRPHSDGTARQSSQGSQNGNPFSDAQFKESKLDVSALIISILLSIILIVFEALCYVPEIQQQQLIPFYVVRLIYYVLLLVVSFFGAIFIRQRNSTNKDSQIHPEIILLLVAATGEFIFLYFGAISATAGFDHYKLEQMVEMNKNNPSLVFRYNGTDGDQKLLTVCALTFVINVVDVLHITAQTFLLIVAESNLKIEWKDSEQWKRKAFKAVLWYLCICNFTKWISESFVEDYILKNSEAKTLVFSMDTRTALTQSTYPLVLFYRFHSGMMLVAILGKLKQPKRANGNAETGV